MFKSNFCHFFHYSVVYCKNIGLLLKTINFVDFFHALSFILVSTIRFAYCADQVRRKPGREVVTFLLVCNLAMWAINTLETNRADSHPIQVKFYGGDWAWPIITHISMPLAIFYRFHSTVCLCEIWKKTFKYKSPNLAYV